MDELLLQLAESLRKVLVLRRAEIWTGSPEHLDLTVAVPDRAAPALRLSADEQPIVARATFERIVAAVAAQGVVAAAAEERVVAIVAVETIAAAVACISSMASSIDWIRSLMSPRSNGVMKVRRTASRTSRAMSSASCSRSTMVRQCWGTASPPCSS